jgi:hypothetical protein
MGGGGVRRESRKNEHRQSDCNSRFHLSLRIRFIATKNYNSVSESQIPKSPHACDTLKSPEILDFRFPREDNQDISRSVPYPEHRTHPAREAGAP